MFENMKTLDLRSESVNAALFAVMVQEAHAQGFEVIL